MHTSTSNIHMMTFDFVFIHTVWTTKYEFSGINEKICLKKKLMNRGKVFCHHKSTKVALCCKSVYSNAVILQGVEWGDWLGHAKSS